jgi:SAM-dependent methyltransferase
MRESIRQFVKVCADTLPIKEPIYEFGSYLVPGQEELADLRPLFSGKKYVGADMRPGPGVDVVLNLHHIDLPSESVGTVLVMDTLEHVEYVRTAVEELHRIIYPGGLLIMSSVMNFPIHGCPDDYWRFTPEAFRSLLKPFEHAFVDFAGDPDLPRTILGVGFKGPVAPEVMEALQEQMGTWKTRFSDKPKGTLKQLKELFVPPILRLAWRKVREFIH